MQKVNITCSGKERENKRERTWVSLLFWVFFILLSLFIYMDRVPSIHFTYTHTDKLTQMQEFHHFSLGWYPQCFILRCAWIAFEITPDRTQISAFTGDGHIIIVQCFTSLSISASSLYHHLSPSGVAHLYCL